MNDPPEGPAGDAVSSGREAEATGETVGEAKWSALRELERRFPGLDKAHVRFVVVSEGERGLLGVGYTPARVVASLAGELPAGPSAPRGAAGAGEPADAHVPGSPSARAREVLERIAGGLGVSASVTVTEEEDGTISARLAGRDLGLLIGKHGQTIDAIQQLVNAIVWRDEEERREIVVDAAGYRDRRRAAVERAADRAAAEAVRAGAPVALEPMTPAERKIAHLYLRDRADVETASEGAEPNRRVVVAPASPAAGEPAV